MRFSKFLVAVTILLLAASSGCSHSSDSSGACDGSTTTGGMPAGSGSLTPACNPASSFTRPSALATNAMSISVNGSLCTAAGASGNMYPDEICASVTICTPGCDNQCQTINDVLLDTGSYGLRLFSSVVNIPLQQVSNDGGQTAVAECVGFGDGSSEWGPVELADVMLAGEPVARNVPIMLINSKYSCAVSGCDTSTSTPDTSPGEAGFNGILGVGLFAQDCGDECASDSNNPQYFSCENGDGCTSTTLANSLQVTNPVAMLSQDNNGVILNLPSISADGVNAVDNTGSVTETSIVFGIDTASGNNSSSGKTFLAADDEGNFRTTFQSDTMEAFIDSGSSDLAFAANVGDCSGHDQAQYFDTTGNEFYCPNDTSPYTTPLAFTGVSQIGATGSPSVSADFSIMNAFYLLFIANNGENYAFSTIAGPTGEEIGGFFDWGLPFFFGKGVAVSIDGTTFSGGTNTGPGWAY